MINRTNPHEPHIPRGMRAVPPRQRGTVRVGGSQGVPRPSEFTALPPGFMSSKDPDGRREAPGCTEPVRTGWRLCGVSTDSSFVPLYTTSLGFPAREQFPITGNARSPKEKLSLGSPFLLPENASRRVGSPRRGLVGRTAFSRLSRNARNV